jgi:hypothetical protein
VTTPTFDRTPTPVAGAILISSALAVLAGVLFARTASVAEPIPQIVALHATLTALFGLTAVGSWRGWQAGQATGVVLGGALAAGGLYVATVPSLAVKILGYDSFGYLGLAVGASLAALLVVPQTSRDWFNYKH